LEFKKKNIDNQRNIDEKVNIQLLPLIVRNFFKTIVSNTILIVFFGVNKKVLS
jgi:hypothetical protein